MLASVFSLMALVVLVATAIPNLEPFSDAMIEYINNYPGATWKVGGWVDGNCSWCNN